RSRHPPRAPRAPRERPAELALAPAARVRHAGSRRDAADRRGRSALAHAGAEARRPPAPDPDAQAEGAARASRAPLKPEYAARFPPGADVRVHRERDGPRVSSAQRQHQGNAAVARRAGHDTVAQSKPRSSELETPEEVVLERIHPGLEEENVRSGP